MPYHHINCGGKISILRRRCSKCGKKWPRKAWFQYPVPPDMVMVPKGSKVLKRHKLTYAKWATKYPGVAEFASRLPRWPRWARILTAVIIFGFMGYISYQLWGLFWTWIRHL